MKDSSEKAMELKNEPTKYLKLIQTLMIEMKFKKSQLPEPP